LRLSWVGALIMAIFLVTLILAISRSSGREAAQHFWVRPSGKMADPRHPTSDPTLILLFSFAAVILSLLAFMAFSVPPYSWDSLTYHLTFPVEWMKKGSIHIVPTPFGDQAPAYSPANGEIFFLWLMLPLGGDLFARVGGLPFYLLSALTIYCITRKVGAKTEGAFLSTSLFLITPSIMRYAGAPEVDLVALFYFLAAAYFVILYLEDRNPRALALASISIGLYLGSKYVALAFAPPLILVSLYAIFFQTRKPRRWQLSLRDVGIFLAGLLACGSFWYLRNLMVTGSPTYPVSLSLGGLTLFQGAYPRSVMTKSIFHLRGFCDFFWTNLRAYGGVVAFTYPLALFALVIHQVSFALRRLSAGPNALRPETPGRGVATLHKEDQIERQHILLLVAPFILGGIHWWLVPYNAEWRFLFPAVALSFVAVGLIYGKMSKAVRVFSPAVLLLVMWSIFVGMKRKGPGPLVAKWAILWVLPLALLITIGVYLIQKRLKGWRHLLGWAIIAVVATFGNNLFFWTLFFPRQLLPPARKAPLAKVLEEAVFLRQKEVLPFDLSSPTYGYFYEGWLVVWENLSGARLAYAGHNIPYHLYGRKWENEVFYVNIDAHLDWKFHDYDLYERQKSDYEVPHTPKTAYYRKRPSYEAWLANLRALDIDYLFIYTLHPVEKSYMIHDEENFPLENIGAGEHAEDFTLVFSNPSVRLYRLPK